jgi:cytochrome bd-type quinol oxidase subunit 1
MSVPEKETFMQKAQRKFSNEPLIPLGTLMTVAFLGAGLRAFHTGQSRQAQYLMRGRVLAQGFTVVVFLAGTAIGLIDKGERYKSYDETKLAKVTGDGEA